MPKTRKANPAEIIIAGLLALAFVVVVLAVFLLPWAGLLAYAFGLPLLKTWAAAYVVSAGLLAGGAARRRK